MPLAVAARRGPRLGVGGTLAVVAMGALLATGFGVLGGKPSPSPSGPLGALGPTGPRPTDAAPTPALPTPAVTPFSPCGPPPTARPEIALQVNGRPTPGLVEILQWESDTPLPDPPASAPVPPDRVSVPVDVITELWIVGGACASSWRVGLMGGDSLNEFIDSEDPLDPPVAAQNRFGIFLAPYGGRDLNLYADLYFPTLIARATWRIHVEPFERPVVSLQDERDPEKLVAGCDNELSLGNGYRYPRHPACTADIAPGFPPMPFEPRGSLQIDRDERLEFGVGDWDIQSAMLVCGHLSGTSFVAEPEPGCVLEASGRSTRSTSLVFPELPSDIEAGAWTLAISACAISGGSPATNSLCGTWYVNVEVRD